MVGIIFFFFIDNLLCLHFITFYLPLRKRWIQRDQCSEVHFGKFLKSFLINEYCHLLILGSSMSCLTHRDFERIGKTEACEYFLYATKYLQELGSIIISKKFIFLRWASMGVLQWLVQPTFILPSHDLLLNWFYKHITLLHVLTLNTCLWVVSVFPVRLPVYWRAHSHTHWFI